MATEVDICSAALASLGANPISSLLEDLDRARVCASLWPIVRDEVLRAHPWNCCIKRQELAALSDAPLGGDYLYQYQLPSDWLRTLSLSATNYNITDFKHESGKILSNETPIVLRYVYKNTSATTYDAMLTQALVLLMSARLAYPIAQTSSLEGQRLQEYGQYMKRVRAVDGMEDPPESFGDYPILSSRYGRTWL